MIALRALLARFFARRLQLSRQTALIADRADQFDLELHRMENRRESGRKISEHRDRCCAYIAQMEDARDGIGEWPEAEQASIEAIRSSIPALACR